MRDDVGNINIMLEADVHAILDRSAAVLQQGNICAVTLKHVLRYGVIHPAYCPLGLVVQV